MRRIFNSPRPLGPVTKGFFIASWLWTLFCFFFIFLSFTLFGFVSAFFELLFALSLFLCFYVGYYVLKHKFAILELHLLLFQFSEKYCIIIYHLYNYVYTNVSPKFFSIQGISNFTSQISTSC